MDYRKFLQVREELILPYFGGSRVDTKTRHYRVTTEIRAGWWQFVIKKREARPSKPAEPLELDSLKPVRGYFVDGWLFDNGGQLYRIAFPLVDEPEPFAPCLARRWYSGEFLFDSIEFEDDAESEVRMALENGDSIEKIKGVAPGLRSAFSYALALKVARAQGVPISPRQISRHTVAIGNLGESAVVSVIDHIVQRRQRQRNINRQGQRTAIDQQRKHERELEVVAHSARWVEHSRRVTPETRADVALAVAGARMVRSRILGDRIEVTFTFMGERFTSLVESATLQVIDSGICLEGTDRRLNLKSLPGAIKQAIATDALNITRW